MKGQGWRDVPDKKGAVVLIEMAWHGNDAYLSIMP